MAPSYLLVAVLGLAITASLLTTVDATDYSGGQYCKPAVAGVKVQVSDVIHKPICRVWEVIRNFRNPAFIPANVTFPNHLAGDQLGVRRILSYQGGVKSLEELVAIDRINYSISYILYPHSGQPGNLPPKFNGTPGPVCSFITTIKLLPITEKGATLVSWESTYTTTPAAVEASQAIAIGLAKVLVQGIKSVA